MDEKSTTKNTHTHIQRNGNNARIKAHFWPCDFFHENVNLPTNPNEMRHMDCCVSFLLFVCLHWCICTATAPHSIGALDSTFSIQFIQFSPQTKDSQTNANNLQIKRIKEKKKGTQDKESKTHEKETNSSAQNLMHKTNNYNKEKKRSKKDEKKKKNIKQLCSLL